MRAIAGVLLVLVAAACGGPDKPSARSDAPRPAESRRASVALRTAPGEAATISAPAGMEFIDLQIDVAASPQFMSYDARVRDRAGEEVWLSDLRRPPAPVAGTLIVSVPAALLKAGSYELTLLGRTADGRRTHFADLAFAVR